MTQIGAFKSQFSKKKFQWGSPMGINSKILETYPLIPLPNCLPIDHPQETPKILKWTNQWTPSKKEHLKDPSGCLTDPQRTTNEPSN